MSQPLQTAFPPIKVVLVEDDLNFQQAVTAAIASAPDISLVNVASTRTDGLRILKQPSADVLLVDLGLPDGSGIDIIRSANKLWPNCNTMVCTTFGDEAHVMQSLEAGASGYLLKDSDAKQLAQEIRNLHAGGSPISPLIARQVLMRFHPSNNHSLTLARESEMQGQGVSLSERECEVLGLITKGFTSNEIAGFLGVTYHTVQTYVRRVYEKLKVNSKAEAIYEARHRGLVKD